MKQRTVFISLAVMSALTVLAIYLIDNSAIANTVGRFGQARYWIELTGQLCLGAGALAAILYLGKVLRDKTKGRDEGGIRSLCRTLYTLHPHAAFLFLGLAGIHMFLVLLGNRPWHSESWTGVIALGLGILVSVGGISKLLPALNGFRSVEKQFHRWASLALVLILLLHVS